MPLNRQNITVASRIMLPTYVAFFSLLGINYAISGPLLASSPALAYAATLLPLPAWGCMFFAASAVMAVALMKHERIWFRFALWVAIVCLTIWAGVFAAAAVLAGASPGAPLWPLFAAVCCFASDRSLLKGEV